MTKNKTEQAPKAKDQNQSSISLDAPWSIARTARGNIANQSGTFSDARTAKSFIEKRTELHRTYVVEAHKTKRLTLMIGCLCLLLAAVLLVFSPEGRETVSYILSFVLFIVAAGSFGYRRVWAKKGDIDIGSGDRY